MAKGASNQTRSTDQLGKTFWLGSAAMGLALAFSGAALAQTAAPAAPQAAGTADEVTVTASRVDRTGYSAPTPTTVISSETLEQQGATNILSVLNEVPAFKATTTPSTNGIRAATPGAQYADLRGLGSTRTLILVDGKRFVPQIATVLNTYQVDLNQIPSILIDRTEVVTGGASAQWGSDALAGVVNIILKKNFEGFQAEVQGGESRYSDDKETRYAFLAGRRVLDGKGNIEVAVDYDRNSGVPDVYHRPWGKLGYQVAANPCSVLATPAQLISNACPGRVSNGLAQTLVLPDVRYANLAPGGIITTTILRGTQFGAGGVPMPFQFGNYALAGNTVNGAMQGGDPSVYQDNINKGPTIENYVHRFSTYARASYDLTPSTTAHVEASFTQTRGGGTSLPARDQAATIDTIKIDNAYLPASIKAIMLANNITSFQMGREDGSDLGYQQDYQDNYTTRIVAGVDGTIFGSWKWDAAYDYGYNVYHLHDSPNRIIDNYQLATDAVVNPANGQVVCRSSLTNPANGCVPMDLFGPGAISKAAAAYVAGNTWQKTDYSQDDLTLNLTGSPFKTWAGPVSVAAGFEYRAEHEVSTVDPVAAALRYEGTNALPIDGKFNTKEVYFESVVPLASDMPFFRSVDLNGAVRVTNYSTTAGTQVPWKVGLTWSPFSGVLFRIAQSHDIRAPNIYELDALPISNQTNITYQGKILSVYQDSQGNKALTPEVGDTFTVGGSYSPSFLRGFQVSIDYFNIDIKNVIAQQTLANITNYCGTGTATQKAYYCPLLTFDSNGNPTRVSVPYLNLQENIRSGLDLAASYRTPINRFIGSIPGALTLNFNGEYALHYETDTGGGLGLIEQVGALAGVPRVRTTTSVGYEVGPLSLQAVVRYIGRAKLDDTQRQGFNTNVNNVNAYTYVDFNIQYNISSKLQAFGVIRNAFNIAPPFLPSSFGYPTNATYYDMIGETFRVGLRYKY